MKKQMGLLILLLFFNCNTDTKYKTEGHISTGKTISDIENEIVKYHENKILKILTAQFQNKSLQIQLSLSLIHVETKEESEELVQLKNGKYNAVISEKIDSKEDVIIRNYAVSQINTQNHLYSYEIKAITALVFSNSKNPLKEEDKETIDKIIRTYFENRVEKSKTVIDFFLLRSLSSYELIHNW